MSLEFLALSWLRFEKKCPYALFQRSPRYKLGLPDVLAITHAGYPLEIEIKRSVQDFRADFKKPHRQARQDPETPQDIYPKQFWYLVPADLVKVIQNILPPWAGLLRGPREGEIQQIYSVVMAPVNSVSRKLSVKEMLALGHCMSNQIYSQALALRNNRWRSEESDYGLEYRI